MDTIPPDTTIDSGPSGNTSDDTPEFTFSSNEPGSTFECQFDGTGFVGCDSPLTTAPLSNGPHSFKVRAVDAVGHPDPTPASRSFTVGAGPTLSVNDVSKAEGNSGTTTFAFKVTLDASSADAVTVAFQTQDGTAVSPSDYAGRTGTVTFAPGQAVRTVNVSVKGDVTFEPTELFVLHLSNPSGATIADADGTGTIQNDDTPTCLGSTATKVGTPGNDTIKGTARVDVINGLGGNDDISGLGAGDKLCGDAGNDTINGGAGNDRISGLGGRDTMIGGPGTDRCEGGLPSGSPGDSASGCETKIGVP
jgi:Ca2+-binding RTX toxin-like protein